MWIKSLTILLSLSAVKCFYFYDTNFKPAYPAFDSEYYEQFLDSHLCQQQLDYLQQNLMLKFQFIDAGLRIPNGILTGSLNHFGNYYQCLGINEVNDIRGKFCWIRTVQDDLVKLREIEYLDSPELDFLNDENFIRKINTASKELKTLDKNYIERSEMSDSLSTLTFRLGICVPRACSTREGLDGLYNNMTRIGFNYEDVSCRLENDKPWVPSDTLAVCVLSVLGCLIILSTSYEVNHLFISKIDPKGINPLYQSFSLYNNTVQLINYRSTPNTIECLDGIRAISMVWVILGHSFSTISSTGFIENLLDVAEWQNSPSSLWISATSISVDTFFLLSGLLLVYTTAGKLNGLSLLKNLHKFYLNRYLRLVPLLAFFMLLQASLIFRVADGPWWDKVVEQTERCRTNWWTGLLFVQNNIDSTFKCLPHSWYLCIDMQLYILSPLCLYWVLNGKKIQAWTALAVSLLMFYSAGTLYMFFYSENANYRYLVNFYGNTLMRAGPFIIGMLLGYLLYTLKGKKIRIKAVYVGILWILSFGLLGLVLYTYTVVDQPYVSFALNIIILCYNRSLWALGLGILIFLCQHGYGGPINWFLSWGFWKIPSKLSFSMYLVHYNIMYIISGMSTRPIYFKLELFMLRFMANLCWVLFFGFIAAIVIEAPFAVVFKILMNDGSKKSKVPAKDSKRRILMTSEKTP